MKRVPSLLSQFARLGVEPDDPYPLADRSLEVVMVLLDGRSAGVFATSGERLTLFASRGIDQHVLDAVETIWRRAKPNLQQGQPVYVPDCATHPELANVTAGGPASLALFPVFDGNLLVALFYVDSAEPHFCEAEDVERLTQFSAMLGRAVRAEPERATSEATDWQTYLERTPVEDIGRQKLLLLLNRNEWNIARVARLMGVTRRTIYLRLRRFNIPRERIYKSRIRQAAAF